MEAFDELKNSIIPIFVLGSPRSGTTLTGNFVGSHPDCVYLGEYFGFYLSNYVLPIELARAPSVFKAEYLQNLNKNAKQFAIDCATQRGGRAFCDSTPWNIKVLPMLKKIFENAIYVFVYRCPFGVIDSLERSYRDKYEWAGKSLEDRCKVWTDIYSCAKWLPLESTIPLCYDNLVESPLQAIESLTNGIGKLGFDSAGFDIEILTKSFAAATEDRRPTIAHVADGGEIAFQSKKYNPGLNWDASSVKYVKEATRSVMNDIFERFAPIENFYKNYWV